MNPRWSIPASFFAMVLGLVGLGNDWRGATTLWGLPSLIGESVMLVGGAVWVLLLCLYGRKWIASTDDARSEIAHPVQCCFVALVPVSTMLMGIAILPHSRAAALALCAVGAIATLAFGVWRHGGLWKGDRSENATTPVLYLPSVAANFVSAMAAGALGWPDIGQLFFGAGVLSWLALESVILHRLLVAPELALPLRPTLGIQLAPPAVGLLAYASITTGPPDLGAHMLLGYALLQALFLLRLMPWIGRSFAPGYWGFTFGITAIAAGAMRFASRGEDRVFATLAPVLFVIANLVVVALFVATCRAAMTGALTRAVSVPAAGAAQSPS